MFNLFAAKVVFLDKYMTASCLTFNRRGHALFTQLVDKTLSLYQQAVMSKQMVSIIEFTPKLESNI